MDSQEEKALKVLQLAADNSSLDSLSDLVKEGVSLDKQDENGWTPLHHASEKGNVESVKNLLNNGAKIDVKNKDGVTAIHLAARLPREDVLMLFINRGVSLDEQDNQGRTALHHACDSGHSVTLWYLLDSGAKADIRDINGQTALHLAAQQENIKLLMFLTEKGLDVDIKDNRRWTPLHCAVRSNLPHNIQYLLEKSAYVDAENEDGDTPLHVAAKTSKHVHILLCYDASVGIRNKAGKTPYQLVKEMEPDQRSAWFGYLYQIENWKNCSKMEVLHSPSSENCRKDNIRTFRCEDHGTLNKQEFEEEVLRIKSTKIVEGFTLYDLVKECEKPTFLLDANLVQVLENLLYSSGFTRQFPHYANVLRINFKRAKWSRLYLTHQAIESVFNGKRQKWCDVTHDIWWHIFSFLPKDDLVGFIRSGDN